MTLIIFSKILFCTSLGKTAQGRPEITQSTRSTSIFGYSGRASYVNAKPGMVAAEQSGEFLVDFDAKEFLPRLQIVKNFPGKYASPWSIFDNHRFWTWSSQLQHTAGQLARTWQDRPGLAGAGKHLLDKHACSAVSHSSIMAICQSKVKRAAASQAVFSPAAAIPGF